MHVEASGQSEGQPEKESHVQGGAEEVSVFSEPESSR